jgi:putative ABC transport system permease protein
MSVGGTTRVPLGSTNVTTMVTAEHSGSNPAAVHEVEFRRSMHNYFATMQMRVRRGRGFTEADGPGSAPAVVINETLARRVFAQQDPLGKRLRFGSDGPWLTVIGVVDDVRHGSLEEVPAPEMYVDYRSNPPVGPFIVIRTAADPAALAAIVRSEARALDPTLALYDITPMSELRATSLAERRFVLLLVGLFGGLALVIAVVGVYGVINLTVTERTPELGVRVALGASRGAVLSLVLRQAASLAIAGAGIGLAIALAITPLLRSQLYGVEPRDPATLVTVPLLLIAIALVAAWIPARRAMRVDPVSALRYE